MRIRTSPTPRTEGDYRVEITPGYGDPNGDIWLDEKGELRLQYLNEDDCARLIHAATEIREKIAEIRAQMAAPHGRMRIYQGTCQLCGKPEDHEDHANEPSLHERRLQAVRENSPAVQDGPYAYLDHDH